MARRHPIARLVALLLGALFLVLLVVTVMSYRRGGIMSGLGLGDRIGLVEIKGVINDSGPAVSALKKFRKSQNIRAVVVRVESPGGGVAPSQEIYNAIIKLRKVKPVVASLGGVAASGGYYIASACSTIVANPGSITGSIGVLMEFGNVEGLFRKLGIKGEVIKAGEHKDLGSPVRELTQEEREMLQEMVDSVHRQFIEAVREGRGKRIDGSKLEMLADGRVFSGEQAEAVGLVDRLGGLEEAIALAAEDAGIKGEPKVVKADLGREPWWLRMLFGLFPGLPLGDSSIFGLQWLYQGPAVRSLAGCCY